MSEASVVAIFLHEQKAGPMSSTESAHADAGRGLVGDRYHQAPDKPPVADHADREVTLIEQEALENLAREHGIELNLAESRRNLVTRGVHLNQLVGREFQVGETQLRGIRPCDPCKHLEGLTKPGVLKGLTNRGGLRAQILKGGTIRVGDRVSIADAGKSD